MLKSVNKGEEMLIEWYSSYGNYLRETRNFRVVDNFYLHI